jgi:hypothetical protein
MNFGLLVIPSSGGAKVIATSALPTSTLTLVMRAPRLATVAHRWTEVAQGRTARAAH